MALFTVKQVAEMLQVAESTVYQLCAARKLRCSRVGLGRGCIRVSEDAIAEYLKSREAGEPVPLVKPVARRFRLNHLSF